MSKGRYYFVVHTCDEFDANTASNIFVQLYGEKGISEFQRLIGRIDGNAFERNKYDVFSPDEIHLFISKSKISDMFTFAPSAKTILKNTSSALQAAYENGSDRTCRRKKPVL